MVIFPRTMSVLKDMYFASLWSISELIKKRIAFEDASNFSNPELDAIFREIAWQAVVQHPLSGVKDANHNGIGDHLGDEWMSICLLLSFLSA